MASDEREKGVKRFNGNEEDSGRQLRRWKAWTQAKMATMKDLNDKQKGPWLFTLLDGKALDAVEHLTLEDLSKEDGADRVFKILGDRFPEKEKHDQMGEALREVFGRLSSGLPGFERFSTSVAARLRWHFRHKPKAGLR